MQAQISKSKFKAHALELFREIESSGESVIITDHGHPSLEVRPYRSKDHNPLNLLRGSVTRFDQPTEPIMDSEWEALK